MNAILGDGAMGTMLMQAGLRPGECADLWNVEKPGAVEAIHREYAMAGAQFLTTNTFGASPLCLARHGLADRAAELNEAAVRIARRASGDSARVLGDVGPFGGFLEPYGETTTGALEQSLRVQITALRDAGSDGIIVETMVDPEELAIAVRLAKGLADWPVVATYAFQKHGDEFRTMMGTSVEGALEAAVTAGADFVGANCGTDLTLDDYLRLSAELVRSSQGKRVILQPNAGPPQGLQATPDQLAGWARKAREIGVTVVGGCCGTTPDHIRAVSEAL